LTHARDAGREVDSMDAQDAGTGAQGSAVRWVRLERRLASSAERAFRAWSDPEELARWLPERIEGALAAGTRSELLWAHTRTWWDVQEVRPDDTFVFRRPWLADDALVTTVRITIRSSGYGCTVELEDGPFPIDAAAGLDAWATAIRTWSEALIMLRAYLDFSVDVRPRR
jgi:uncharacterized protein YndB with AHSA1/START domain